MMICKEIVDHEDAETVSWLGIDLLKEGANVPVREGP